MDKRIALAIVFTSLSTVVQAQQLKEKQSAIVEEARKHASSLLQHPRCAAVFGDSATEELRRVEFRIVPLGRPRLRPDGAVIVTAAATLREFNVILINRDGPFFATTMASNRIGGLGVDFRFGLAPLPYRALVMLHELGHVTGKFKPDASDSELATFYTQLVRDRCF